MKKQNVLESMSQNNRPPSRDTN